MQEIKTESKKSSSKKSEQKYVTVEQFGELLDLVKSIASKPAVAPTEAEVKKEKEIAEVGPDNVPVNPQWEKKVREIIGKSPKGDEIVDRCEMMYPKHGGTLFTVVIKKEFSNAPVEYLKAHMEDRRTRKSETAEWRKSKCGRN